LEEKYIPETDIISIPSLRLYSTEDVSEAG